MQLRAGKFRVNQLTGDYRAGAIGDAVTSEQDLLIPGQGIVLTYETGNGASGWTAEAEQLFQPGQTLTVIFTDEA